jgi:hypothetical protein
MRVMAIRVPALGGGGLVHHVFVSLPYAAQLIDGVKYMDPADVTNISPNLEQSPPQKTSRNGAQKRGFEQTRRTPRAPSLRSLVRLAQACDSAEELGKKLRRRYDRSLRRQGIDPNRGREAKAERELERLLQD